MDGLKGLSDFSRTTCHERRRVPAGNAVNHCRLMLMTNEAVSR
jgi:hypothetical protein